MDFIPDAAIAVEDGTDPLAGRGGPTCPRPGPAPRVDGRGALGLPGLRGSPHPPALRRATAAGEFNRRLHGVSYAEIAAGGRRHPRDGARHPRGHRGRAGGHRRGAPGAATARKGVVHLEAKTGYGLELEAESRLLEAYGELGPGAGAWT